MNKYKLVSLALGICLIGALVKIVRNQEPNLQSTRQAVLDNILSRKSVRSYTEEPVGREQLDTLVRAAMAAPSGRDMRPWKFIIVDERALLDSLAESLEFAKMAKEAPVGIIVCGDLTVKDDHDRPSRNWILDCSAATENILLTAEAMGLGAVWTGVYPYEERIVSVQQILSLPNHIIPLAFIPIGHPKGDTQPKDKYNKDNIHFNGW